MKIIELQTMAREELIDVTPQVKEEIRARVVKSGLCCLYVPHTTAALTINENADPDVKRDILLALRKAVPDSLPYEHTEGNSPAHVKSSIIGQSVTVFIEDGDLQLGIWQGICFCEFDGPRRRKIFVKILPG